MKCRSFKLIREDLEALAKVTSKATLITALPVLVEAQAKIAQMRKTIKSIAELTATINDECSKYALDHESIFVGGKLLTDGKGVKHGTLETDSEVYYFAAGYGKPIRRDGDMLTQDFLDGLPKNFTKGKLELNCAKMTDEELAQVGLVRSANNAWSVDHDDAADSGD